MNQFIDRCLSYFADIYIYCSFHFEFKGNFPEYNKIIDIYNQAIDDLGKLNITQKSLTRFKFELIKKYRNENLPEDLHLKIERIAKCIHCGIESCGVLPVQTFDPIKVPFFKKPEQNIHPEGNFKNLLDNTIIKELAGEFDREIEEVTNSTGFARLLVKYDRLLSKDLQANKECIPLAFCLLQNNAKFACYIKQLREKLNLSEKKDLSFLYNLCLKYDQPLISLCTLFDASSLPKNMQISIRDQIEEGLEVLPQSNIDYFLSRMKDYFENHPIRTGEFVPHIVNRMFAETYCDFVPCSPLPQQNPQDSINKKKQEVIQNADESLKSMLDREEIAKLAREFDGEIDNINDLQTFTRLLVKYEFLIFDAVFVPGEEFGGANLKTMCSFVFFLHQKNEKFSSAIKQLAEDKNIDSSIKSIVYRYHNIMVTNISNNI